MQQDNDGVLETIVFSRPNGSRKSTITRLAKVIELYINADDIKRTTLLWEFGSSTNGCENAERYS